jgi:hypothetical protein
MGVPLRTAVTGCRCGTSELLSRPGGPGPDGRCRQHPAAAKVLERFEKHLRRATGAAPGRCIPKTKRNASGVTQTHFSTPSAFTLWPAPRFAQGHGYRPDGPKTFHPKNSLRSGENFSSGPLRAARHTGPKERAMRRERKDDHHQAETANMLSQLKYTPRDPALLAHARKAANAADRMVEKTTLTLLYHSQ